MKNKMWELIEDFINKKIDEAYFCENFFILYTDKIDYYEFDEFEQKILSRLSEVAGRFSAFETDHKQYPGLYYTKEELLTVIQESKEQLQKRHPEYFQ